MNTGKYLEIEIKEQTFLFEKEPLTIVRNAHDEIKTSSLQKNETKDDSLKDNADLNEEIEILVNQNIEFRIWRNRKIQINKSLIPLRAAMFLWFASGSICSPFFSLMLTHRGLKIEEFSPVFSAIFLSQLIVAYICGIITDKIGNAKPVLLCVILGVISVLIGLLLAPDMRDNSCLEMDTNSTGVNMTCLNVFNYTTDLDSFEEACCTTYKNYSTIRAENKNNKSLPSNLTHFVSNKQALASIPCSYNTDVFCNEICSCFEQSTKNPSSAYKIKFKIIYSVLILSFFSFWSTGYRFLDFASLTAAKELNSHYGNERFYGVLGTFLAAILCSFVLNIDKSETRGYYDTVFWFGAVLFTLALISAINIKGVILPPGQNLTKNTLKMFNNIEMISVILIAFVAGTEFAFNEFYDFWYLESLNASKITISLHLMSHPFYGLPIYITCKWWLRIFGRKKIFIIGLLCYTIKEISYSFLYYSWHSLIIETMKPFAFHLFWIAMVTYCNDIAPKGFAATVNAVVGTVHFGIGRSFSVSVGGYLISAFGIRSTYRILASFSLFAAMVYAAFLYLRRLFSVTNSQKQSEDIEEAKSIRENEALQIT